MKAFLVPSILVPLLVFAAGCAFDTSSATSEEGEGALGGIDSPATTNGADAPERPAHPFGVPAPSPSAWANPNIDALTGINDNREPNPEPWIRNAAPLKLPHRGLE